MNGAFVSKNTIMIPITRDLAIDAGLIGPRAAWPPDPEGQRWRDLWHARPGRPWWQPRFAPPWEWPDRCPLPEFTLFPRWVERLCDWVDRRFP